MMTQAELLKRFNYHAPKNDQATRYQQMREMFQVAAELIDREVPDSREKATALTHLETAMFWANAGIARNE